MEARTHARLRDGRGLHYLLALLAAPGRDIPALELAAGGGGLVASGSEPVLDEAARRAYRRRLTELGAELDHADRAGDPARTRRAETERQALLDELRRASGLAARSRGTSQEAERARVNVTRTLRSTLARIAERAPVAAAHLQGVDPDRAAVPLRPRHRWPHPMAYLTYRLFPAGLRLPG